ncbi:MAG: hypothetical protein ACP5VN_11305 [Acidobacteriota bacterium]
MVKRRSPFGRGEGLGGVFCWAAAVFLVLAALPALADYRFQVLENRSRVTINPDASLTVAYAITFANEGQPIDVVDVGLPSSDYDRSSLRADLDGRVPLTDIRPSEYVKDGVEVHLSGVEIRPGASGTLHLSATVRNRVFRDDADKAYASVVFSPTWYGADFTRGTTHLVCEFVFPEGVGPQETRYHRDTPFTSARVEGGRVVYRWEIPQASPSSRYTFGASFPARVMARLAEKPKGPGPVALLFRGLARLFASLFPCLFFLAFFGIAVLGAVQSHRRRLQYLPPTVGMEGVEVRRGLTVPEVAVLQEQPVNRVLSLLLFGLVRKKLLEITSRKPLRFKVLEGAKPDFSYEAEFLKAVKDDGRLDEGEAARVLTDLVKKVAEKMKGYSRKKTLAYYRTIMDEAWKRVGTEDYSQAFEWMLLDKDFEQTATRRWGSRPLPVPGWWGPVYGPSSHVPSGAGSGGGVGGGLSGALSDISAGAHGIVSGLEGFANDLVGSVPGLASKVTAQTNPVPVSSGGGHSGGGCACACACAGCACACAGGGR